MKSLSLTLSIFVSLALSAFAQDPSSDARAAVEAAGGRGVLVEIISCDGTWCHVAHDETDAWTQQDGLWGVYPGETIK